MRRDSAGLTPQPARMQADTVSIVSITVVDRGEPPAFQPGRLLGESRGVELAVRNAPPTAAAPRPAASHDNVAPIHLI